MEQLHILGQCIIAVILGGIVGWERESAGKWAGLRTHMLVCLATMLFVRVGELLILESQISGPALDQPAGAQDCA